MLLDIVREDLYIKNKVYETMNEQMEQRQRLPWHSFYVVQRYFRYPPSTNDTATAVGQHSAVL